MKVRMKRNRMVQMMADMMGDTTQDRKIGTCGAGEPFSSVLFQSRLDLRVMEQTMEKSMNCTTSNCNCVGEAPLMINQYRIERCS